MKNFINLKKDQIEFLLNVLNDEKIKSRYLDALKNGPIYEGNYQTKQYHVFFSENEKQKMLDELSSVIMLIGINSTGEINKKGLAIEEIIDLFLDA